MNFVKPSLKSNGIYLKNRKIFVKFIFKKKRIPETMKTIFRFRINR